MITAEDVRALVEAKAESWTTASRYVWEHPELYFQEKLACAYLSEALSREGFAVKRELGGMPTAFLAEYGSVGPVIGFLAEYDALPGLSQKAGLPRCEPLRDGAAGHGCGHNILGVGAVAAAVAVKQLIESGHVCGTVRLYGCPAEEAGWGKMYLARDGHFNDLAAAITWHPNFVNAVQGWSSLAVICAYFRFTGVTAHAAAAPHLGRSALDACELMSVGVNYLREHVVPGARLHYAYQDAGGAAPNVVPARACVKYFVRAPRIGEAREICERVKDVARGAALMTGTKVEIEVTGGICDYVPNDVLGAVFDQALRDVGGPRFSAHDQALARQFCEQLGENDKQDALRTMADIYPDADRLSGAPLLQEIAPYARVKLGGVFSTDVGDVSYAAPTVQLNTACYASGTPGHSWQLAAQAASSISDKGLLCAAAAMALGAARLLEEPGVLARAREEYVRATGGRYVPPIEGCAPPSS